MPIYRKQNTFTSGEISPRLKGRTDFAKYDNATQTMLNCYPQPHGGCTKRSGTQYINKVKDSTKKVRLVGFEFSTEQTYILEFGNLYVRFYKDQGRIQAAGSISAISKANPGQVTQVGHGLVNNDTVNFENVVGMTQLNGNTYTVTRIDDDNYTIGVDTSAFTTWVSGGEAIVEVTTTYTEAELFDLDFTQSADTLYITHVNHAPAKLTRTSHTSWAVANLSFTAAPGSWGAADYPRYVTFFENRLVFASNVTEPQTIWFSKIGSYLVFTVGTADDDPVTTTIVSNEVNSITWMSTTRDNLFVGTTGGEWTLEGDVSTGITPSALKQKRESTHGSKGIRPLPIESQTLFIQRQGKSIREFRFVLESDSFQAPELSILAEHLTRTYQITDWAYSESPNSIVWAIRSDGRLLGMTYRRTQDVVGWHQHNTGATGKFESVAAISGNDRDEVWLSVNRTIDGGVVRYIELLAAEFNPNTDTDATNGVFLDSSLSYSGSATDTFAGLDHLEGESISVLADGKVHPNVTVTSGAITLNYDAEIVTAGISYNSDIETLPIEFESQQGTSSGRSKRITRTVLKLHETIGIYVGKDEDNLEYIPFNDGQIYGNAVLLFSGDKVIDNYVGNTLESTVYIRSNQPLPMTVLSIVTEIEVNAR